MNRRTIVALALLAGAVAVWRGKLRV